MIKAASRTTDIDRQTQRWTWNALCISQSTESYFWCAAQLTAREIKWTRLKNSKPRVGNEFESRMLRKRWFKSRAKRDRDDDGKWSNWIVKTVYIFAVVHLNSALLCSVLDTVVFVSETQMNKIVARKVNECEKKKLPPTPKKTKHTQNIYAFSWRKTLYSHYSCVSVEDLQSVVTENWKQWQSSEIFKEAKTVRETMMRRRLLWKRCTTAEQSISQARRRANGL